MKKNISLLSLSGVFILSLMACSKSLNIPNELAITSSRAGTGTIHTELQEGYANSDNPAFYISQNDICFESISASVDVVINWDVDLGDSGYSSPTKYIFEIAENNTFNKELKTITTKKQTVSLSNLKVNIDYSYRITAYYDSTHQFVSETYTFKAGEKVRNINAEGVENIRDIGGYNTENGKKIKQGMLYRSAQLNYDKKDEDAIKSAPTSKGKNTLVKELKIKTEVDLREKSNSKGKDETIGLTKSPLGSSVNYVNLPMRYGGTAIIPNEFNKESLESFFNLLTDESNYPIVFHCIQGKDRTGALAYVLGTLCGASYEDMLKDYLFSNFADIGSKTSSSGMNIYENGIKDSEGDTISKKTKNYLMASLDISETTLDSIIDLLTE